MDVLPSLADDSDLPWELVDLDETDQGTPSSSASVPATHSEAQGSWMQRPASQPRAAINSASPSHSSPQLLPSTPSPAGPPSEVLPAPLACVLVDTSMSSLPNGASGVCLHRISSRAPNRLQAQRLSAPPEDDDVIFVRSVQRKRHHNLSAGASDDSCPVKRPRSSRVNVLLTQVTRHFHDEVRVYHFNRATQSWQDKHDDTVLPDVCFGEGGDYKTLTVKVHPGGLSGMPVFLSWDEEEGMFCGYDTEKIDRRVGRQVVEELIGNPGRSLKVCWPDLDDSL